MGRYNHWRYYVRVHVGGPNLAAVTTASGTGGASRVRVSGGAANTRCQCGVTAAR